MKIPKSEPIAGVLIVLVVLAVTFVMLKLFTVIMIALWVMSIILWVEFDGALSNGSDSRSSILSFFVNRGMHNGLSATEICTRGRKVAGSMALIIPLIYLIVRLNLADDVQTAKQKCLAVFLLDTV